MIVNLNLQFLSRNSKYIFLSYQVLIENNVILCVVNRDINNRFALKDVNFTIDNNKDNNYELLRNLTLNIYQI